MIRAYIRLQSCTTNERRAFVSRQQVAHSVARGTIGYFAVEGDNWTHVRKVLKTFDVLSYSSCGPKTVLAFAKDIGTLRGRLYPIMPGKIPEAAWFEHVRWLAETPQLSGFGPDASVRV